MTQALCMEGYFTVVNYFGYAGIHTCSLLSNGTRIDTYTHTPHSKCGQMSTLLNLDSGYTGIHCPIF